VVLVARKLFRLAGQVAQSASRGRAGFRVVLGFAAGGHVGGFTLVFREEVEHGAASYFLDLFLALGVRGGRAIAKGGRGRRGAGAHRPEKSQGRPPPDPLAELAAALVLYFLAGVAQHPVKEFPVFGRQAEGGLGLLPLRERSVGLHEVPDVAAPPLDEMNGETPAVALVFCPGQVLGQRGELRIKEREE